jgi:tetratricopeptide (TPR) repeat protein
MKQDDTMEHAPPASAGARPYIVKTYDRWIILAIVLIGGWLLFRPLFAFAVYYRGLSFEHMLELTTAEHYYRKAIGIDAKVPEGWIGLSELYMMGARSDHSMYQRAADTLEGGLSFNPHNGALAFDLCRTYYEVGRKYDKARDACELATRNDPANHFAWDYAGWANLRVGNRKAALDYWREAVKRGHATAVETIKHYSSGG